MPGNQQVFSAAINAAERYRWDSNWTEANQEYQKALSEFPDDATARSGLGFCHMQTKQWQEALNEYKYVLQRDPGHVIALSKTAELYGILNRREDAYHAYSRLANLYSQAGQGARAEAAWQKAVQLSPGNPEPHERLASYYFEKKDIAAMIQQRLAAAQGYLLRNDPGAAHAQCEEVLRADSTNVQAQQLLTQMAGGEAVGGVETNGTATPQISSSGYIANRPPVAANPHENNSITNSSISGNTSGGNTGIMGNMGSAGNYGGVGNQGPAQTMTGAGGINPAPHKRISASQVTEVLKQAQMYQEQRRFNDAIDLCEQILESGFDRPDARYFLGWLYQEQQRWDEAIRQFQHLLNDPDYALSCYYALGQCYRARGDLRSATIHFDEAVDRVNLDALTLEESDQLVQLCQEAAEAHRMLGEQEQALTVYNALLGFLHSRGWNDKVAQVDYMLQQAQTAPPAQSAPPPAPSQPLLDEQTMIRQQPAAYQQNSISEASTMAFDASMMQQAQVQPSQPQQQQASGPPSSSGELPDWLTGILSESDKTQAVQAQMAAPPPAAAPPPPPPAVPEPPTSVPDWLTAGAQPAPPPPAPPNSGPPNSGSLAASAPHTSGPLGAEPTLRPPQAAAPPPPAAAPPPPVVAPPPTEPSYLVMPDVQPEKPSQVAKPNLEDLLGQISGGGIQDRLHEAAEPVLASTAELPENVRRQVIHSMQDIQKYIDHGLLTSATEECLRVIDIAPQYLDVHQVLCEIYVRQGKVEQAVTKYAILVDTYIVNGRVDDAIATYRRILQLEPNNLTYRMRLISLLSSQGNKEDLLRERTQAAEAYLRLGYMDRALTELEQALEESPTSVPTRLNYALALQKLGRQQQAVAEYQRVLQVDPRNLTALVRWHISMATTTGTARSGSLEILTRIRWQMRGEGQKHADIVMREYQQALESFSGNADLHFALGQIYQQAGMFDRAIDEYTSAQHDSEIDMIARASAAQCFLQQGKPEAAINQLEQALQIARRPPPTIDPATWAARPRETGEEHKAPEVELSQLLANAYRRTGRFEQAEAIQRRVKQLKPSQNEITSTLSDISARHGDTESTLREYADLVRHYRSSRQIDNALNVLNEMVRLSPQDSRAHSDLADIYINRGLLDEGIAELRLLADIYLRANNLEQAGEVIQRVGNLYSEMSNDDEALTNLRRATELLPDSMELLREVVGLCMRTGRAQEAAKYQINIARYYFDTRQVKESVAALQQLIAIDRNNLDAYDMLGQTYQSVGEYEQASRVYRNLAKVSPGNTTARERLATLQDLRSH